MKRYTIFSLLVLVTVMSMLTGCSSSKSENRVQIPTAITTISSTCTNASSLVFPRDNYTVQTKTMTTSTSTKQVTFHLYKHITYVVNPVDANYESMDVSVPVKIDGTDVDASNAPILLDINVAGYMSSTNTWLYWDGGHAVNEDPEAFIAWIATITGYIQ